MVTGCIGICAVGPVMVVEPDGVLYTSLDPERAALIARRHLLEGEIVEECTFYDHDQKRRIPHLRDIGFFREQVRIALRNCGRWNTPRWRPTSPATATPPSRGR